MFLVIILWFSENLVMKDKETKEIHFEFARFVPGIYMNDIFFLSKEYLILTSYLK